MQLNFVLSMVFALFVAIFAIVNSEPVTVNLFVKTIDSNMAVVIFFATALGGLIVFLFSAFTTLKKNRKIKSTTKSNTTLEAELEKAEAKISKLTEEIEDYKKKLETCEEELISVKSEQVSKEQSEESFES